jgi:hypothetical protein
METAPYRNAKNSAEMTEAMTARRSLFNGLNMQQIQPDQTQQ